MKSLGSISAVFSSPVFDPPEKELLSGVSAGSIPEQRLVIEPMKSLNALIEGKNCITKSRLTICANILNKKHSAMFLAAALRTSMNQEMDRCKITEECCANEYIRINSQPCLCNAKVSVPSTVIFIAKFRIVPFYQ